MHPMAQGNPYLKRALGPVGYPPGYHAGPNVVGGPFHQPPSNVVGRLGYEQLAARCPPDNRLSPQAIAEVMRAAGPLSPMAAQGAAAGAAGMVAAANQIQADFSRDMFGVNSGAALIAPAAIVTIIASPQKNIIPERLLLSDFVANNFDILDIRCGVDPILSTTGPIPAVTWRVDSNAANFRGYAMPVGMDFSIQVQNVGGADARFACTVMGRSFSHFRSNYSGFLG